MAVLAHSRLGHRGDAIGAAPAMEKNRGAPVLNLQLHIQRTDESMNADEDSAGKLALAHTDDALGYDGGKESPPDDWEPPMWHGRKRKRLGCRFCLEVFGTADRLSMCLFCEREMRLARGRRLQELRKPSFRRATFAKSFAERSMHFYRQYSAQDAAAAQVRNALQAAATAISAASGCM